MRKINKIQKQILFLSVSLIALFFAAGKTWATDGCVAKYGVYYVCTNISSVKNVSDSCKGSCPDYPSDSSKQCCLAGSTTFGNEKYACADNFSCVDKQFVSSSSIGKCTDSCKSETTANGICCPLNLFPQVINNTNEQVGVSSATANGVVPGSTEAGGLIQCGRGGQKMCTLCDVIVGINNLIKYMFRISIVVGIAAFTLGGVMYVLSVADSDLVTRGKLIMQYAAIGIVVMASAWLMVNYTMTLLGKKETMGITKISGWDNFSCTRRE